MSPEPIQPHPVKQHTWEIRDLSIDIITRDLHSLQSFDNEDEHTLPTGYLPLSQEPLDSDSIVTDDDDNDDDDDDDHDDHNDHDDNNDDNANSHDNEDDNDDSDRQEAERLDHRNQSTSSFPTTIDTNSTLLLLSQPLQLHTNSPHTSTCIHLDTNKINQVKSMMANFQLPTHTHPPWATTISEDQWKKQLIDTIQQNKPLPISSLCQ